MKKHANNYLFAVCAVVLVFLCARSIYVPIHFNSARETREIEVKARLRMIRHAEEYFRRSTGVYSGDFNALVSRGLLADSARFIPHSGGKVFKLRASTIATPSGREVPVMECGATYDEYLEGLDAGGVAALIESAETAGIFPGLRIGNIEKDNDNAGNWE